MNIPAKKKPGYRLQRIVVGRIGGVISGAWHMIRCQEASDHWPLTTSHCVYAPMAIGNST